jgi:hypothetical protein
MNIGNKARTTGILPTGTNAKCARLEFYAGMGVRMFEMPDSGRRKLSATVIK